MSATYAYNVGLGLNFSGQDEGEQPDVEMAGYPQDSTYSSYSQGISRSVTLADIDYSSPMITSSPHGHFFVPRISRSEGNPVCILFLKVSDL